MLVQVGDHLVQEDQKLVRADILSGQHLHCFHYSICQFLSALVLVNQLFNLVPHPGLLLSPYFRLPRVPCILLSFRMYLLLILYLLTCYIFVFAFIF